MFEDAYYNWREEPDDGEYELQFDHFESSADGYYHDHAALFIVDAEMQAIGDVTLPTEDVPEIEPDDSIGTAIFRATIEDSEIIELVYDPDLTEQRLKEAEERYERVRATSDDETTEIDETEDQ